jgi:hypothetical protein
MRTYGHPNSTWGVIEGNILQDAATQNCLMAKPDFMLNVNPQRRKEITNVFAVTSSSPPHRLPVRQRKRHVRRRPESTSSSPPTPAIRSTKTSTRPSRA